MKSSASRRQFLKQTAALSGTALLAAGCGGVQVSASLSSRARNLIFLVADGMNMGTLSLADAYQRQQGKGPLRWVKLYDPEEVMSRQLVRSLVGTRSANSSVTDSAAAGSAWSIGERINNRALCVTPDGRKPTPLFVDAKRAGKATGLVTTTRMTHATPASFACNLEHRNQEDDAAVQFLERGIDLLLGGGNRHFDLAEREDRRDLYQEYRDAGYSVVRHKTALAESSGLPLLGIFSNSHIPYEIDRLNQPSISATVPSLREMTEVALDRLASQPEGFVLQVEGGRIDHAGHANDAAGILHDMLAFDDMLTGVLNWVDTRGADDTLVIVTTDHGTGGCQLNGWGDSYLESDASLANLENITASFETFVPDLMAAESEAALVEEFRRVTGLSWTPEEEAQLVALVAAAEGNRYAVGGPLGNLLREKTAVGWTSGAHTADHVEFAAFGPGSEKIPAFHENYELTALVRSAIGLPPLA